MTSSIVEANEAKAEQHYRSAMAHWDAAGRHEAKGDEQRVAAAQEMLAAFLLVMKPAMEARNVPVDPSKPGFWKWYSVAPKADWQEFVRKQGKSYETAKRVLQLALDPKAAGKRSESVKQADANYQRGLRESRDRTIPTPVGLPVYRHGLPETKEGERRRVAVGSVTAAQEASITRELLQQLADRLARAPVYAVDEARRTIRLLVRDLDEAIRESK